MMARNALRRCGWDFLGRFWQAKRILALLVVAFIPLLALSNVSISSNWRGAGYAQFVDRAGWFSPVTGHYYEGEYTDDYTAYSISVPNGTKAKVEIEYTNYESSNGSKYLQVYNVNSDWGTNVELGSSYVNTFYSYVTLWVRARPISSDYNGNQDLRCSYDLTVTYESLAPDLTVSDLSTSPSSEAEKGEAKTLSFTVKNIGGRNSAVTTATVYDEELQIGSFEIESLSGGGSVTKTLDITNLSLGKHTLRGEVMGVDGESTMSNNSRTGTLLVFDGLMPITVRFDANGGAGTMLDRKARYGNSIVLPACAFEKLGYEFQGWALSPNGAIIHKDCSTAEVDAHETVTLYAVWGARRCITFDANGGTGTMPDQYFDGEMLKLQPNQFKREGYEFVGWGDDSAWQIGPRFADGAIISKKWLDCSYTRFNNPGYKLCAVWGKRIVPKYDDGIIARNPNIAFYSVVTKYGSPTQIVDSVSWDESSASSIRSPMSDELLGAFLLAKVKGPGRLKVSTVNSYKPSSSGAYVFELIGFTGAGLKNSDLRGQSSFYNVYDDGKFYIECRGEQSATWEIPVIDNGCCNVYWPSPGLRPNYIEVTDVEFVPSVAVTFEGIGGITSPVPKIYNEGEAYGELPTATKRNSIFLGWFTSPDGGSEVTSASIVPSGPVTLYGHWATTEMFDIVYDAGVYAFDSQFASTKVRGEPLALTDIPFVRDGYTQTGWSRNADGSTRDYDLGASYTEDAAITLYPYWTANSNSYTIRFVANGGSGTMADQTLIYDVAQMLSANRFKCEGMHFVGWATSEHGAVVYKDKAEVKNLTVEQGGLVCLYAVWEDGSEGLYPNDHVGVIDSDESAPYASVATTYDGYLYGEDDIVVGSVQVKVAKGKKDKKSGMFSAKVTATVRLADGTKKISFNGGVADAAGMVTGLTAKGHTLEVSLGVNGLGGTFDGKCQIDGARNVFGAKDAEAKAAAAAVDASWAGEAINIVSGGDVLTVAIAKKGKVKVSGMVNGVKVSATSQLLVGETCCCIPVVIDKKANLAFTLWLEAGGIAVVGLDDDVVADTARPLKSGAKFNVGDAGAALVAALGVKGEFYGEYLPDGLSVAQSGKKWIVAGGAKAGKVTVGKTGVVDETKLGMNPSGLKLTYTEKSGSFKGSFKVYNLENGKVKSYTVNVTGVMIGDIGYGTATLKKPACSFPISIK